MCCHLKRPLLISFQIAIYYLHFSSWQKIECIDVKLMSKSILKIDTLAVKITQRITICYSQSGKSVGNCTFAKSSWFHIYMFILIYLDDFWLHKCIFAKHCLKDQGLWHYHFLLYREKINKKFWFPDIAHQNCITLFLDLILSMNHETLSQK